MRRHVCVAVGLLLITMLTTFVFAQIDPYDSGGQLIPEQSAYDVTSYDLSLQIFPDEKSISGHLTVEVNILDTLNWFVMDLDTLLSIDSISIVYDDGSHALLSFERRSSRLWIELHETLIEGKSLEVNIVYGGKPRVAPRPPWEGGFNWSQTDDGSHWIGVTCILEGADVWWPCKDHPSDRPDSLALHVTVPEPLICVSNGRLMGISKNDDNTRTFHWFVSTPINNYGVTVNVAPYETIEETYLSITGEEFPVTFWALPESVEKARVLLSQILQQLWFLESILGPYPFRIDKYSVAQTDYRGMDHQTIISYGGNFKNNGFGFDNLHLHELSHEWWGALITPSDWKDSWLKEGFAEYTEALYAEHLEGSKGYHEYLAWFPTENLVPVAPTESQTFDESHFHPWWNNDIYYKGALILHSLRYLIGEEVFFTSIRRMAYSDPQLELVTTGEQCRFVDTDDFRLTVENYSELELEWFFDVYLHQPKLPKLFYSLNGDQLELEWEAPEDLPFPMPIDVKVGNDTIRVEMAEGIGMVEIGINDYVIDPLNWVLKDTLEKSVTRISDKSLPQQFAFNQNYPNPFNPTSTIEFSIPQSGTVALTVYDVLGRVVETILNKQFDAGHHKLHWNASDVPSGIYFIRMQSSNFTQVRKVMVVR